MEQQQITMATRCLWELQEMTPDIIGVMLVSREGFALASTFPARSDYSRLAAVSAALMGLSRQSLDELDMGELNEIRIRYRSENDKSEDALLTPVDESALLVVALRRAAALSLSGITVPFNIQQAAGYLLRLLDGEDEPPQIQWL